VQQSGGLDAARLTQKAVSEQNPMPYLAKAKILPVGFAPN
jgi:hypothetical protein